MLVFWQITSFVVLASAMLYEWCFVLQCVVLFFQQWTSSDALSFDVLQKLLAQRHQTEIKNHRALDIGSIDNEIDTDLFLLDADFPKSRKTRGLVSNTENVQSGDRMGSSHEAFMVQKGEMSLASSENTFHVTNREESGTEFRHDHKHLINLQENNKLNFKNSHSDTGSRSIPLHVGSARSTEDHGSQQSIKTSGNRGIIVKNSSFEVSDNHLKNAAEHNINGISKSMIEAKKGSENARVIIKNESTSSVKQQKTNEAFNAIGIQNIIKNILKSNISIENLTSQLGNAADIKVVIVKLIGDPATNNTKTFTSSSASSEVKSNTAQISQSTSHKHETKTLNFQKDRNIMEKFNELLPLFLNMKDKADFAKLPGCTEGCQKLLTVIRDTIKSLLGEKISSRMNITKSSKSINVKNNTSSMLSHVNKTGKSMLFKTADSNLHNEYLSGSTKLSGGNEFNRIGSSSKSQDFANAHETTHARENSVKKFGINESKNLNKTDIITQIVADHRKRGKTLDHKSSNLMDLGEFTGKKTIMNEEEINTRRISQMLHKNGDAQDKPNKYDINMSNVESSEMKMSRIRDTLEKSRSDERKNQVSTTRKLYNSQSDFSTINDGEKEALKSLDVEDTEMLPIKEDDLHSNTNKLVKGNMKDISHLDNRSEKLQFGFENSVNGKESQITQNSKNEVKSQSIQKIDNEFKSEKHKAGNEMKSQNSQIVQNSRNIQSSQNTENVDETLSNQKTEHAVRSSQKSKNTVENRTNKKIGHLMGSGKEQHTENIKKFQVSSQKEENIDRSRNSQTTGEVSSSHNNKKNENVMGSQHAHKSEKVVESSKSQTTEKAAEKQNDKTAQNIVKSENSTKNTIKGFIPVVDNNFLGNVAESLPNKHLKQIESHDFYSTTSSSNYDSSFSTIKENNPNFDLNGKYKVVNLKWENAKRRNLLKPHELINENENQNTNRITSGQTGFIKQSRNNSKMADKIEDFNFSQNMIKENTISSTEKSISQSNVSNKFFNQSQHTTKENKDKINNIEREAIQSASTTKNAHGKSSMNFNAIDKATEKNEMAKNNFNSRNVNKTGQNSDHTEGMKQKVLTFKTGEIANGLINNTGNKVDGLGDVNNVKQTIGTHFADNGKNKIKSEVNKPKQTVKESNNLRSTDPNNKNLEAAKSKNSNKKLFVDINRGDDSIKHEGKDVSKQRMQTFAIDDNWSEKLLPFLDYSFLQNWMIDKQFAMKKKTVNGENRVIPDVNNKLDSIKTTQNKIKNNDLGLSSFNEYQGSGELFASKNRAEDPHVKKTDEDFLKNADFNYHRGNKHMEYTDEDSGPGNYFSRITVFGHIVPDNSHARGKQLKISSPLNKYIFSKMEFDEKRRTSGSRLPAWKFSGSPQKNIDYRKAYHQVDWEKPIAKSEIDTASLLDFIQQQPVNVNVKGEVSLEILQDQQAFNLDSRRNGEKEKNFLFRIINSKNWQDRNDEQLSGNRNKETCQCNTRTNSERNVAKMNSKSYRSKIKTNKSNPSDGKEIRIYDILMSKGFNEQAAHDEENAFDNSNIFYN